MNTYSYNIRLLVPLTPFYQYYRLFSAIFLVEYVRRVENLSRKLCLQPFRIIITHKISSRLGHGQILEQEIQCAQFSGQVEVLIVLTYINHLQTKRRLRYLKTQFVPRRKYFPSRL